jgi:hypothetical protein
MIEALKGVRCQQRGLSNLFTFQSLSPLKRQFIFAGKQELHELRLGLDVLVRLTQGQSRRGRTSRHRDHTSGALAPLVGVQLDQASDVDRPHWV